MAISELSNTSSLNKKQDGVADKANNLEQEIKPVKVT